MKETEDYFGVKAVSNSALSYISPEQGGSPQAYKDFFIDKQEEEKKYFKMGHLIHLWAEDRNSFLISSVSKPSEKLGDVADIAELILKERTRNLEEEGTVVSFDDADYDNMVLEACKVTGWNRKWGDAAIIKNASPEVKPYLQEIQKAESQHLIYVSTKEAEVIRCCVESVEKHPIAKDLLFMQDTDFSNKKVFSELEVYWEKSFNFRCPPSLAFPDGEIIVVVLQFKAKLDKLTLDFDNKTITYVDPKTTSKGAYSFAESFEKYHYYRQQSFYNWAIREFCKQQGFNIEGFTFKNYNVVIETNGLFQTVVWQIGPLWLFKGNSEYQSLIKRIVEHEATNQWNYSLEEVKGNLVLEVPFKEVK